MTIKIKAPRAYYQRYEHVLREEHKYYAVTGLRATEPVRIVREADWRKLMKLVRACEPLLLWEPEYCNEKEIAIQDALDALKGAK